MGGIDRQELSALDMGSEEGSQTTYSPQQWIRPLLFTQPVWANTEVFCDLSLSESMAWTASLTIKIDPGNFQGGLILYRVLPAREPCTYD